LPEPQRKREVGTKKEKESVGRHQERMGKGGSCEQHLPVSENDVEEKKGEKKCSSSGGKRRYPPKTVFFAEGGKEAIGRRQEIT